jgi:uncharacterized integral membrane protein
MNAKQILILVVAVLALIVMLQNTGIVSIQLLFWKISMSRIIMLAFLLLAGFLLGILVSSPVFRREKPGRRNSGETGEN